MPKYNYASVRGKKHFIAKRDRRGTPTIVLFHGYGADVPVLVGWESQAGLYMLWGGLRAGWEHIDSLSR